MLWALSLALNGALLPAPAPTAAPESVPPSPSIAALIRDLGAESYEVRERASEELLRLGHSALPQLEQVVQSEDPEVRLRARQLIRDIRLGLSPDWPPAMVKLVHSYNELPENQRLAALKNLTHELRERAIPFLLSRMGGGSAREAKDALAHLRKMEIREAYRRVLTLLEEPQGDYQSRALAWAQSHTGSTGEALRLLSQGGLDNTVRREMVEAGVQGLLLQLENRKYREVANAAPRFIQAVREDARFRYLAAEALLALDQDEQAGALRREALALNPAQQAPHFTAAEMLEEMGRRRLATQEWKAILSIPPGGDIYDINAHLRLSDIYSASRLYQSAAQSLQKALDLILQARAEGHAVGIVGATEDTLRTKLEKLYRKAARFPQPADAAIRDRLPEDGLSVNVTITVKEGKLGELGQALATVAASLTMQVEPFGLRLFDVAPVKVSYDVGKHQILVLLNDSPCSKPIPFHPEAAKVRIAVQQLDCCYIYQIDTVTGTAEQVARFEKDYTVTLRPGIKIAAYTDVAARINDKRYDWDELLEGIDLDYLPKAFDIVLEGTTASGRRATSQFKIEIKEPPLKPPVQPPD